VLQTLIILSTLPWNCNYTTLWNTQVLFHQFTTVCHHLPRPSYHSSFRQCPRPGVWRSSISLQTKIRLYIVYIPPPILLYGADTWSMTMASSRRLDAFDQWCLLRIVHIPYTAHITNEEVRHRTGQPPVTSPYRKETTSSDWTSREIWSITRPLAHPSSSHQSSSSGLETPGRLTKADRAPYNRARPSAT